MSTEIFSLESWINNLIDLPSPIVSLQQQVPFAKWWQSILENTSSHSDSVEKSIQSGIHSPCVAYAFAGGYINALHRMIPQLPSSAIVALCVTEKGGNHPKDIQASLKPIENSNNEWTLDGIKDFVTLADEADILLIAVSMGFDSNQKNQIRLVALERAHQGLTILPIEKPISIVPEISHGRLKMEHVHVSSEQILSGDGYTEYVKRFRTLEDLHVLGGVLGYLLRISHEFKWQFSLRSLIISLLAQLRSLSLSNLQSREAHILLGGIFQQFDHLIVQQDLEWESVDSEIYNAWKRDRNLFKIAGMARQKRLENAWKS